MDPTAATEVNPSKMSMDEVLAGTRSSAKGWVGCLKHYRSVSNAPFVVRRSKIEDAMRLWCLATLDAFPQTTTEASEKAMWDNSFSDEHLRQLILKETPNFKVAARDHLGTHTAKVPNPIVSGPGGLIRNEEIFGEAARLPFVSSASINVRQRMGAAGNAAQGRAQRFLCGRFLIDGEAVDASRNISEKGVVYEAMVAIGFDRLEVEDISNILAARMSQPESGEPGQFAKGLIWPVDEGDVVITPVHPYAMHVELAARIKDRVAKGKRISNTHVVVGGSKPQNAGLVNSDMGGRHRLLHSFPPKVASRGSRSLFRMLATGKIPFGRVGKGHPAVADFRDVANKLDWVNESARQRLDRCIGVLVSIVISPYVEVADAWASEGRDRRVLAGLPEGARRLISDGFDGLRDCREEFMDELVGHVAVLPHGVAFDQAMNRRAVIVAESIVSRIFKG